MSLTADTVFIFEDTFSLGSTGLFFYTSPPTDCVRSDRIRGHRKRCARNRFRRGFHNEFHCSSGSSLRLDALLEKNHCRSARVNAHELIWIFDRRPTVGLVSGRKTFGGVANLAVWTNGRRERAIHGVGRSSRRRTWFHYRLPVDPEWKSCTFLRAYTVRGTRRANHKTQVATAYLHKDGCFRRVFRRPRTTRATSANRRRPRVFASTSVCVRIGKCLRSHYALVLPTRRTDE